MSLRSEISLPRDPLDALLLAIGLRFYDLSKRSAEFQELLRLRNFTLQIASKDGSTRCFIVSDGNFHQSAVAAEHPDLALTFASSMLGVKLITRSDPAALINAIQSGELESKGDFALLLWFAQAGSHLGLGSDLEKLGLKEPLDQLKRLKRRFF